MKKIIQFVNKTWEYLKAAYTRLRTRYKRIKMPLIAKCSRIGTLWSGYFEVA